MGLPSDYQHRHPESPFSGVHRTCSGQARTSLRSQQRTFSDSLPGYQNARFDIIEQEETPVGRLYVHRLHDEIRVIDIALLPEHRGRGLGGGLLRALLEEAAAVGKPVYIYVEQFNPAMRLYQRLGFVAITDEGVYGLMKWSPPRVAAQGRG